MQFPDIVAEAVEHLRSIPDLAGIPILREDAGDVSAKLQADVAKCALAVVVGWDGFTPIVQGATAPSETPTGTVGIVATVYERPAVNRAKSGAKICQNVALVVASSLERCVADGMESPFFLKSIGKVAALGDKADTVFCDVQFETKASL